MAPNLSLTIQTQTARELLESIVTPSAKIAPNYASTVVVLKNGEIIQGRIEREDKTHILLRTGDLLAPPSSIPKSTLVSRALSHSSTMPEGIVNTLRSEEILDLLAYIQANGDLTKNTVPE